jgi:hypothetical protein
MRTGDLWPRSPVLLFGPLVSELPTPVILVAGGVLTPVLAKHSKAFSLIDCHFGRCRSDAAQLRAHAQAGGSAAEKRTHRRHRQGGYLRRICEGQLEAPKHLARTVHDLHFEPKYEEFRARTIWSLSNAFTSAFTELDPIPQFKATAKLGEFLEARFSQSF